MKKRPNTKQKRAIKHAVNQKHAANKHGIVCPYCETEKPRGWPVCDPCRLILPQRIKGRLRAGLIGYDYNQAMDEAMAYLKRFGDTALPDADIEEQTGTDRENQGPGSATTGLL